MRLWSIHPKYLDSKGLVALWREALLAQAVLREKTRGYRNHPQLIRFKDQRSPLSAIGQYLEIVYSESLARGYKFNQSKIGRVSEKVTIQVTSGQIEYEWSHLLAKLKERSPALYQQWKIMPDRESHPLFHVKPGKVAQWERQ